MRAMARSPGGRQAVLAELKGVDAPIRSTARSRVGGRVVRAPGPDEIFIAPELAERLSLRVGERLRFGEAEFRIAGIIAEEPDRVGEGFTLGPVAIVSLEGLQPDRPGPAGQPVRHAISACACPASAEPEAVVDGSRHNFPASSWEIRDRDRAAPGASRFFERMGQFLTLIGLAALIIAGIGVSNGVASYLRQKRDGIATLKMLGATSARHRPDLSASRSAW